ncbi:universal stress protein [Pseudonocardia halophobica]|uniref:Universal stress protein n=1 Tax=Pseudonocardia halophobica TaxID=29401 RepID=A0A9W6NUN6_9PSEU|nr:universal stress protein [Pseudonocardia halophobica]GLL09522.1 universal stress protein [Pseudonocardia halophobica]
MVERAVREPALSPAPAVVVGIDGSRSAIDAATWAAREADRRGAVLRLIEVVEWQADATDHPEAADAAERSRSLRRHAARRHVDRAAEHAGFLVPEARIIRQVIEGAPADVLGRASDEADLVVIGGPVGGWSGTLLGLALAARSSCPLVFVEHIGHSRPDGPVVVGVDGSPGGDAALRVALHEAREREVPLEIVHAWSDTPLDPSLTPSVDFAAFAPDVRAALDERVAPWVGAFPEVEVRHAIARDRPEAMLAEASQGAHLLVVGGSGRHEHVGLALGEVARRVVLLAHCPVAVVGPRWRGPGGGARAGSADPAGAAPGAAGTAG